jgi:hypothetical protein
VALQRQLLDKGTQLRFLAGLEPYPHRAPETEDLRRVARSMETQPGYWATNNQNATPGADLWRATLARLREDATAPLPDESEFFDSIKRAGQAT